MHQLRVVLPSASCNLNCKYCINKNNIKGLEVGIDFDKLFAKTDLADFQDISIWGGEPLFNPNLEKVLRALREHYPDKEIFILSNGTLLNKYYVELFNELDISYGISHDGPSQSLRCKDFLQDESYIELLKQLKHFTGFNSVISRDNCDLVGCYNYFLEACDGIDCDWQVSFGLFELSEEELLDFMPSVEQYAALKKSYKEIMRLAIHGAKHLDNYAFRYRHRARAPRIWRCGCDGRLTIDTGGNVYQCQMAADRRDLHISKPSLPFMCINCRHADYCRGICPLFPKRLRQKLCLCHHLYYDALEELYKEGEDIAPFQ